MTKESYRADRRLPWIDDAWRDLRYAVRTLLRNPGFSCVTLVTLALGIGANSAVFTVANAVLLKPLPYTQAGRLIWIEEVRPQLGARVPGAHFLDWQEYSRVTDGIAAYTDGAWTLIGTDEPERLEGYRVSASLFPTLGVEMLLGRAFLPIEDRPAGERVAIISHSLWQRQFNGDPSIVGRSIRLEQQDHRVVGVLPPTFRFFAPGEVWLPLVLDDAQEQGNTGFSTLSVFARLRPGVSRDQAAAEFEHIKRTYGRQETVAFKAFMNARLRLTPLHEQLVGDTRLPLLVLLGAVALTLLVACANVANLLLARSLVRQKELATRAAFGASRARLLRQVLTESLLLALCGGILGVILASWLTQFLVASSPVDAFGSVALIANFTIDGRVLAFTLLVSLFCAVCFGLVAAVQPGRAALSGFPNQRGSGGFSERHRIRQALLVGEVAVAIVLLVGTGLFVRSFANLLNVEPGYRSDNLLTSRISLPVLRYQDRARRVQVQRGLMEQISALPGVESVGLVSELPLTESRLGVWLNSTGPVRVTPGATPPSVPAVQVSSDYFAAMGTPLRAGRVFDARENADGASPVIILSESVARQLFPNEDPIDRRVWMSAMVRGGATVVGVVADVRHEGLDRDVRPQIYIPYQQFPPFNFTFVARTAVDPPTVVAAVRAAVLAIDPELPVFDISTMEQRVAESVAPRRFLLLLVGGLAFLALVLALVGLYGLISYLVSQRTREIGIRVALGARRGEILALVLRQGLAAVVGGIVIGILGAIATTRYVSGMLFELDPLDPTTFVAVALAFASIAILASYIPARRALRIDPVLALRME